MKRAMPRQVTVTRANEIAGDGDEDQIKKTR